MPQLKDCVIQAPNLAVDRGGHDDGDLAGAVRDAREHAGAFVDLEPGRPLLQGEAGLSTSQKLIVSLPSTTRVRRSPSERMAARDSGIPIPPSRPVTGRERSGRGESAKSEGPLRFPCSSTATTR